MSDKIELEVVATFDGLYIIPLVALERGTDLCRLADAKRFIRAALAQQPAQAVPIKHDRAEAERCLFVLREIASMDAEDIAGDNIDLRFEDADGRDTGCDASIVEYAQRAADVIEKLLAAAPAAPAAQEPGYPPCDYCGTSVDYMPWHGSGLIGGIESRHIHACDACRDLLPAPPAAEQPDTVKVPRELLERMDDTAICDGTTYQLDAELFDELRTLLPGGAA